MHYRETWGVTEAITEGRFRVAFVVHQGVGFVGYWLRFWQCLRKYYN